MIRINLAKASSTIEASTGDSGINLESGPAAIGVKILLMFLFVFGLYIYEGSVTKEKTRRIAGLNVQLKDVQSQIAQYGGVSNVVADLEKERTKLKIQMSVIEKISKKRNFKLSTIQTLQQAIPGDCWLEELNIKNGVIEFKGFARTPSSVQTMVSRLEELEFLDSPQNKELKRVKLGITNVHEFNIFAKVVD